MRTASAHEALDQVLAAALEAGADPARFLLALSAAADLAVVQPKPGRSLSWEVHELVAGVGSHCAAYAQDTNPNFRRLPPFSTSTTRIQADLARIRAHRLLAKDRSVAA